MAELHEKKEEITTKEVLSPQELTQTTDSGDSQSLPGTQDKIEAVVFDVERHTDGEKSNVPVETARDVVTEIIHAQDDPSLNPWTFRTWFLGLGLSSFGAVLSAIYFFKPQPLGVSSIFLGCISYVLGELMAHLIPRYGPIGRFLNPGPFNSKEHAAIILMSSTAANAPLAISVLAVTKLYYNKTINSVVGFLLIMATQCLGYGVAGLMRSVLIYPTKMLYPSTISLASLVEVLHGEKSEVKRRLRVFYIGFGVLFLWEFFPQFIMPLLTGISVFCLIRRDNMVFTNVFGGSNGNEGLGLFSICLDWQYVTGSAWLPLQTLMNEAVGSSLCVMAFALVYYTNAWNSQNLPFLSQMLFSAKSTSDKYIPFNQTAILDEHHRVNDTLLAESGIPYFTGTFIVYLITTNIAITATFVHILLYNYSDMKDAWSFVSWKGLKQSFSFKSWQFSNDSRDPNSTDPHVQLMLAYKDTPNWWYGIVLVLSIGLGLIATYLAKSTMPFWAFLIATALSSLCTVFFGAQYGLTGFHFNVQPVIQMIGGYLQPGKPVANMYFTLIGYDTISQAQLMLRDLKFGQYTHLSPRCLFTMQMVGTLVGSLLSYIIMGTITDNQREILLSIEGTNIWSGQALQTFNSQAIAWGGLASKLFSAGKRYQWVPYGFLFGFIVPLPLYFLHRWKPRMRFDYWNTPIIAYFIGWLFVGINSSVTMYFVVGFFCQFWLRKYRPVFFKEYNYILSAAMDGGTQVLTFILTFALFGGAGKQVNFPPYWGNNFNKGNYDYCLKDPGSKGE